MTTRAALLLFVLAAGWPLPADAGWRQAAKPVPRAPADGGRSRPRPNAVLPVAVENIRLEPGPADEASPSALVTFDLRNDSSERLTAFTMEISIDETPGSDDAHPAPSSRLRPFTIHGDIVLEPGYTVTYKMLLRNFTAACDCTPQVKVRSTRVLLGSPRR